VTTKQLGRLAGVALVGALALTACGSDNNSAGGSTASGTGASGTGSAAAADCGTGTLNAEGSTAQQKAIEQAIADYQSTCSGVTINYNGSGSGAGVKQFIAGQVAFAGTDSALKTVPAAGATATEVAQAATTCGSPAWNIPLAAGAVAIGYNVKGMKDIVLDAPTLASILKGKVTTWNDPAIAKLNSGMTLPSEPVKVFFRSDDSGTTDNLTTYLKAAAPSVWTDEHSKTWKGSGEGKKGSGEVSKAVKATEGGIGYMEQSYIKDAGLTAVKIGTSASDAVAPEGDALAKGVASAKISGEGNDVRLKFDYAKPAAGAYPIPIATYEAVCSKYKDAAMGKSVKGFLKFWAQDSEQQAIAPIGYSPLSAEISARVKTAIDAIS
jgi:phosphate transport system substrate-binding protein